VRRLRQDLPVDVTYSIEPEHTIPAARNHALRLARGDYIAIIDDDERPPADWLLRMYEGLRTHAVNGVLGPIEPFFPAGAPAWLSKSHICALPSYPTGTLLHWSQTRTGNVLLEKRVFEQYGLAFDPAFRTGGSDQELFRQAAMRGCRFVALADAPVYETVPPARWTRAYWIKRALINGFNARRYSTVHASRVRQAWLTVKSILATVAYGLALPVCACMGQHRLILCLEKGAYHFSHACAGFGIELWKTRDF
jgi:succinoglycan biosynthesis protein ExoM